MPPGIPEPPGFYDSRGTGLDISSGGINALTINNSVIAENVDKQVESPDILTTDSFESSYNNLVGNPTIGIDPLNGNIILPVGAPAGLAPLSDNGGPTHTHALLPGSPAIDAGSDSAASGLATDQRGFERNIDFDGLGGTDNVDIGAYELGLMVSTLIDEDDFDYTYGDQSLREALRLAAMQPEKDQILFAPSLAGGTIELGSLLLIDNDVEIVGLGPDSLTIDANASASDERRVFSVFNVNAPPTVTIEGLTITGGYVSGIGVGGGISSIAESLTLRNVVVRDNYAGDSGGGISAFDGSLYLVDSTITENTAGGDGGGFRFKSDDELDIIGSTIADNVSGGDGGGVFARDTDDDLNTASYQARVIDSDISDNEASGSGGGIRGYFGSSWLIENSTVSENKAGVTGGGLANSLGSLIVSNSEISDNLARDTGGGFWLRGTTSDIYEITNSTIASNRLEGNPNAIGAGISIEATSNFKPHISIQNSTISSNYSPGDAGGIYLKSVAAGPSVTATIVNSTITENTAVGAGGGIVGATASEVVTLHNTILAGNKAASLSDFSGLGTISILSSFNLLGNGIGDPGGAGNVILAPGLSAGLAQLASYGGPTQTHVPLPGSPAIDAGDNALAAGLTTDQRGYDRDIDIDSDGPPNGTVDIGATESSPLVATADFNGDSRDDYAFLDALTGTVYVILGEGGVAGSGVWMQNPSASDWTSIETGDFNGDGRADLAVFDSIALQWSLAISDSTQFSFVDIGVGTSWSEFHVGDFDGDGADELLGWNDTNWEVLDYDEKFGATLKNWGTAVYGAEGVTPADIQIGDANRDGRDDLIAYNSVNIINGQWWVGLSQYDPIIGDDSFVEQDWDSWFDAYADPTTHVISDPDIPIQQIIDEFEKVYNTVELELYAGFLKGIEATAQTEAGNQWDQAALLVDRLDASGFDAKIALGTIEAPWESVRDWLGAPQSLLDPSDPQANIADIIANTFDKDAVVVPGTDNIRFRHAWVEVEVPTVDGLAVVSLDPSWKFKDRQPGILADQPGGYVFGLNIKDPNSTNASIQEFLVNPDHASVLNYFEEAFQDFLVANYPGKSIADVAFDGPIIRQHFEQIPLGHGEGITVYDSDPMDSDDEISRYEDLGSDLFLDTQAVQDWTFTAQIEFFVSDTGSSRDGLSIFEHDIIIPQSSLDEIVLSFSGQTPQLRIGGITYDATEDLLTVEQLRIAVSPSLPELVHPDRLGTPPFPLNTERVIDQDVIVAIGFGARQHSITHVSRLREDVLSKVVTVESNVNEIDTEDIDNLLTLVASEYWFEDYRGSKQIDQLTNSVSLDRRFGVLLVAARNTFNTLEQAPYGFLPDNVTLDIRADNSEPRPWNLDVTASARATHNTSFLLSSYFGSELEHAVLERVLGVPSLSTVEGLRRASKGDLGVYANGSPSTGEDVLYYFEKGIQGPIGDEAVIFYEVRNDGNGQPVRTQIGITIFDADTIQSINNLLFAYAGTSIPSQVADFLLHPSARDNSYVMVPKLFSNVDSIQAAVYSGVWVDGQSNSFRGLQALDLGDGSPIFGGTTGTNSPPPADELPDSGSNAFNPVTGDPVDVANGNLIREETDFLFPNLGTPLDFNRRYNSQTEYDVDTAAATPIEQQIDVGLGIGWTHSFSDRLIVDKQGQGGALNPDLIWLTSSGERHTFEYDSGSSSYVVPSALFGEFVKPTSIEFQYLDRDGTEYHFDSTQLGGSMAGDVHAVLKKKLNRNNDGFEVFYDVVDGTRITSVEDVHTVADVIAVDRKLVFRYEGNGKIQFIDKYAEDLAGAATLIGTWEYSYDTINGVQYLIEAKAPTDSFIDQDLIAQGATELAVQYAYYGDSSNATDPDVFDGLMKRITEPNGEFHHYEYYLNRRVFRVQDREAFESPGSGEDQTFTYNLVRNSTEFKNERDEVETYLFQKNGLLTRQIHPDRTRVEFEWGAIDTPQEFLMTSTTDEVGATETFEYYTNADVTAGTASDFEVRELKEATSNRFLDPFNSGLVIGQDGVVTQFDYSQPLNNTHIRNVSTITVDPGAADPVTTQFVYDPEGRTTKITDDLNNDTLFSYFTTGSSSDGLLETTTDPKTLVTVFTYDASGNVTSAVTDGLPSATLEFDHNGNATSITDATSIVSTNVYDVLGRLRSTSNTGLNGLSAPLTTVFGYDPNGLPKSTIDALNRVRTLNYDNRGNVIEQVSPDGTSLALEYDSIGNLISQTDELNQTTRFVYDSRNRVIQTIHPDGATERIRYDGVGRISAINDALGNETTFVYDAAGRLTESVDALGGTTTNKYDIRGNLVETIDPIGNVAQFTYDSLTRITKTQVLDIDDPVVATARTVAGPVTRTLSPVSLSTIDYDVNGNVERVANYDVVGLDDASISIPIGDPRSLITSQPALVQVTETIYDSLNRPTATIFKNAAVTGGDTSVTTAYDFAGRVRFQNDELNRPTELRYDAHGRLEKTLLSDPDSLAINASSPTTTFKYDAAGNVVAVTDARQNTTTNVYDSLNRLISTANAENEETRFVYDVAGQLVAVVDALGRASYTQYDSRGRVTFEKLADPDANGPERAPETVFKYDAVGNTILVVDALGNETAFGYDELNRQISELVYADIVADDTDSPANVEFSVGNGTPTHESGQSGRIGSDATTIVPIDGTSTAEATWTFNNLSEGIYRVFITWDEAAGLDQNATASISVDAGSPVVASLDQTKTPEGLVNNYEGQWIGWTELANNIGVTSDGLSLTVELKSSVGSTIRADAVRIERISSTQFSYDDNGNLETTTDALGRTTTFTYDELNRLESETLAVPDGTLESLRTEFVYDGYGNTIKTIEKHGTTVFRETRRTYDKRNRLVTETLDAVGDATVTTNFEYDDVGNLTRMFDAHDTVDEVVSKSSYDNLNRQIEVVLDTGRDLGDPANPNPNTRTPIEQKTTFQYDALGNLTLTTEFATKDVTSPSVSTLSTYDALNRLIRVDRDSTSATPSTTQFVYDETSNLIQEIDPTNRSTSRTYDRLNRLVSTVFADPDGSGPLVSPSSTFTYSIAGDLLTETNGEGETIRFVYDSLGRQVRTIDAAERESRSQFDPTGNLVSFTDANQNTTTYLYDDLDRLTQDTNTLGYSRFYTYNNEGELARVIDRNEKRRDFTYDGLGRVIEEEWWNNELAESPSDSLRVHRIVWEYDKLGRVLAAGDLPAEVGGDTNGGSSTSYWDTNTYDNLGRVTEQRNYSEGNTEITLTPWLDIISNPLVKQNLVYDILDLLNPNTYVTTQYTQQVSAEISMPSFTPVGDSTFSTDRLGRVSGIDDLEVPTIGTMGKQIAFDYEDNGLLKLVQRTANGGAFRFDTSYTYDGIGRAQGIEHTTTATLNPIVTFGYAYDAASRITNLVSDFVDSVGMRTQVFQFDNNGQLTNLTTTGTGANNTYTYDDNGNRTSEAVDKTQSNVVAPNNQISTDGTYDYAYDREGNLTRRTEIATGSTTEYVWDHRNRLISQREYGSAPIDFNTATLETFWGVPQSGDEVLNNGSTIRLTPDEAVSINLEDLLGGEAYHLTSNTVLEFDYVSTLNTSGVIGFFFANRLDIDSSGTENEFRLNGTYDHSIYINTDNGFEGYEKSEGTKHFRIDLGSYLDNGPDYLRPHRYLVFWSSVPGSGYSEISSLRIYERNETTPGGEAIGLQDWVDYRYSADDLRVRKTVNDNLDGKIEINFNDPSLTSFPSEPTVGVSINNGTGVLLGAANSSAAIDLRNFNFGEAYQITENSVLEFDLEITSQPLNTGFNFYNPHLAEGNQDNYFKLFGFDDGSYISLFPEGVDQYETGDNVKHYRLRVGEFFRKLPSGLDRLKPYTHLAFRALGGTPDLEYSNVTLYEDVGGPANEAIDINFSAVTLEIYRGKNGTELEILDSGNRLRLEASNVGRAIDLTQLNNGIPYEVTANTILEFDFESVSTFGHVDISLQNHLLDDANLVETFKVYGIPGGGGIIDAVDGFPLYDPNDGQVHYRIKLGSFFERIGTQPLAMVKPYQYLAFLSDNGGTGWVDFSNVKLYEDPGGITFDIDFNHPDATLSTFNGQEGGAGDVVISTDGSSLTLTGDTSRALDLSALNNDENYQVTANTIIEFDFSSTAQSQFQGIMLRNNIGTPVGVDELFAVYGDYTFNTFIDYLDGLVAYDPADGTRHYRIRVGDYLPVSLIQPYQYLVFLNDTVAGLEGNSTFSNISIYEEGAAPSVVPNVLRQAETEHYAYNGDQRVLTLSDEGTLKNRYTHGPGTDNLLVDEVFDDMGQVDQELWAVTDHLGTVHDFIDGANHNLVEHREYDAFGNITELLDDQGVAIALDQMASDVAFAGRVWDNDTELYYNRARWYDANLGRFISEDPIGFAGGDANLYRYAGNDPANFRDPSGLTQAGNPWEDLASRLGSEVVFASPGGFSSLFSSDRFEATISRIQIDAINQETQGLFAFVELVTKGGLRLDVGFGRTQSNMMGLSHKSTLSAGQFGSTQPIRLETLNEGLEVLLEKNGLSELSGITGGFSVPQLMREVVRIVETGTLPSQLKEAVRGIRERSTSKIATGSKQGIFLQAILDDKSFLLGIPPTGGPQFSAPGTPPQRDPRDTTFSFLWNDRAKRAALNATDALRFFGPSSPLTIQNPGGAAFIHNDSTKSGQSEVFRTIRDENRRRGAVTGAHIEAGLGLIGKSIESAGLRNTLLNNDVWVEVTIRNSTPARIRAVVKIGDFRSNTVTRPPQELKNANFAGRVINEFSGLRRAGIAMARD